MTTARAAASTQPAEAPFGHWCMLRVTSHPLDKWLITLFWGTLQGTASTTPPINGNASGVVSERCPWSFCPIPSRFFGPIMPTTLGKTTPPGWTSPDHAKEQTDAARRRAQKTQLMRRRRAELTPSNQDLHKAQNTQSRRRKRAELSPEDKDQANQERRVKRRYDKDSPDRRALINQSQRRRRAELTPSNKDVAKALDTQSRRRKRAERSPEDAQRRKAMDTLWRRRLNSARAAGRGRVLESMS